MTTTNTGFVITDVGNAAATVATPGGPFVHITQFKVGSAFNYTPLKTDTDLHGTVLYTGGVTNYYVVDHDTIEVILFMDTTVGPFSFGEIGIYLADGTLFAICTFDTLQEKIKAVGNQAGSAWRIRGRLKLSGAAVICQVDVITSNQALEVANWQALVTPANQAGNANFAIVADPNSLGQNVTVFKNTPNDWTPNDYVRLFSGTTASGGTIGTATVSHPSLSSVTLPGLPLTTSRYIIKFPDGDIRKITSQVNATTYAFSPAKAVTETGTFEIWEDLASAFSRTLTSAALSSALASYVTSASLASTLAGYATNASVSSAISSALVPYATIAYVNAQIASVSGSVSGTTRGVSAYSAGVITVPVFSTFTTVQTSPAISVPDSNVLVVCSVQESAPTDVFTLRIFRDGGQVYEATIQNGNYTVSYVDQPGAGSHTYSFALAASPDLGTRSVTKRGIAVITV